ncbi:MAG: hypothetical protein ABIQ18_23750 [Umezawaea sp.]
MTGDNVGQYAFEQYREQGGGTLASIFTMGMSDIVAATKAIGAATEAQALSVDPHLVDTMLKKLTDMQDVVDKIQRNAHALNSETKLGGGYAQDIGRTNQQLGGQVTDKLIPDMVKAINSLKAEIEKSRATYQNSDVAHAGTFNNL